MKPREFDELVRQKFDQNDFEYSPRNWDRLAEELDGRSKKRSFIMWWLMPLAGVAASVALAVGVSPIMKHSNMPVAAHVKAHTPRVQKTTTIYTADASTTIDNAIATDNTNDHKTTPHTSQAMQLPAADKFGISYENAVTVNNKPAALVQSFNFNAAAHTTTTPPKEKETKVAANEGYHTFKPEEEVKKEPKLSVIISGGISHGSQNSGYTAGATIRRMINEKVYIESDVAFTTSTQTTSQYGYSMYVPAAGNSIAARTTGASAKTTSTTDQKPPAPQQQVLENFETTPQSYNLNYAQVTPSIGVKIIKRMSIGVGPDFQQMLSDNRPSINPNVTDNVKVAPTFDVGFVGKTEYNITRTVKAAVAYRKGVNNIITPTDKYLDRDYLQFQVKCAIFNK